MMSVKEKSKIRSKKHGILSRPTGRGLEIKESHYDIQSEVLTKDPVSSVLVRGEVKVVAVSVSPGELDPHKLNLGRTQPGQPGRQKSCHGKASTASAASEISTKKSHVNMAFQDDDGCPSQNSSHLRTEHGKRTSEISTSEQKKTGSNFPAQQDISRQKLTRTNATTAKDIDEERMRTTNAERNKASLNDLKQDESRMDITEVRDGQLDNSDIQHRETDEYMQTSTSEALVIIDENLSAESDGRGSPWELKQACIEDVEVVDVTQPRALAGHTNKHFRSNSSAGWVKGEEPGPEQAMRSYSMRVASEHKPKQRSLLRDLSFSDADAMTARNFGSLRTARQLPRRKPAAEEQMSSSQTEDTHVHMTSDIKKHLENVMLELLARGKVRQVAVLAQRNGEMLASLPHWNLPHKDEIGLVKAATCNIETMMKMAVDREDYTFFKHGTDKITGRSGSSILVAQKTASCVVVGVADDQTPGSCLYEVSELAQALIDKGW